MRVKEETMRVKGVIMVRSTYWQYSVSITRVAGRRRRRPRRMAGDRRRVRRVAGSRPRRSEGY